MLSVRHIAANAHLATTLKLELNAEIVCVERIRILGGEAVINETIYISAHILPKNIFENLEVPNSLYAFYQQTCGMRVMRVMRVIETIEADMPNADDMKRLNIKKHQPMLMISRTAFGANDVPIEFRISRVNSNKHVYWAELK